MTERFDGGAVWAALSPAQRDEIGPLALEMAAARYALICADDFECPFATPAARAAEAADARLDLLFHEAIAMVVPEREFTCEDGTARLPVMLGPVCRSCGCTDHDACPEGCEWAGAELCSACADRGLK